MKVKTDPSYKLIRLGLPTTRCEAGFWNMQNPGGD